MHLAETGAQVIRLWQQSHHNPAARDVPVVISGIVDQKTPISPLGGLAEGVLCSRQKGNILACTIVSFTAIMGYFQQAKADATRLDCIPAPGVTGAGSAGWSVFIDCSTQHFGLVRPIECRWKPGLRVVDVNSGGDHRDNDKMAPTLRWPKWCRRSDCKH